ncbi:MAG: hypothetical protein H7239_06375 [Flavobacterium sp.]|nr:hypothetical protein [Flavobacterium sp.]
MKKITASRLSEGNKIFPAEIIIEPNGLIVKISGLFSGQSRHLDYHNIGEVSVDAPLVGFSTITFFTAGTRVSAHGFSSAEVKQIKLAIEKGKNGFAVRDKDKPIKPKKTAEQIIAKAEAEKIEYELENKKKFDNSQRPWLNDNNFKNKSSINAISFPNDIEDVEKTILRLTKAGTEMCKAVIETTYSEFQEKAMSDQKANWNPFHEELGFVEACIDKSTEGIKKLKRLEASNINIILADCQDSIDELRNKWLPKLMVKREKKKKQNLIIIGVIVFLIITFYTYVSFSK